MEQDDDFCASVALSKPSWGSPLIRLVAACPCVAWIHLEGWPPGAVRCKRDKEHATHGKVERAHVSLQTGCGRQRIGSMAICSPLWIPLALCRELRTTNSSSRKEAAGRTVAKRPEKSHKKSEKTRAGRRALHTQHFQLQRYVLESSVEVSPYTVAGARNLDSRRPS